MLNARVKFIHRMLNFVDCKYQTDHPNTKYNLLNNKYSQCGRCFVAIFELFCALFLGLNIEHVNMWKVSQNVAKEKSTKMEVGKTPLKHFLGQNLRTNFSFYSHRSGSHPSHVLVAGPSTALWSPAHLSEENESTRFRI